MWKVFSSLNKKAAGSLRSSVIEESPGSLVSTVQLSTLCRCPPTWSSSSCPTLGQLPRDIPAQIAAQQLFDSLLTGSTFAVGPPSPTAGLKRGTAPETRPRLAPPCLVVSESLRCQQQFRQNENGAQALNVRSRSTRQKEHGPNEEEVQHWKFVELVQYSSLLAAGYNIIHKQQDFGWREYILPQSSCPALAVQNKLSLYAQPRRDEDAIVPFGPRQLGHREEASKNILSDQLSLLSIDGNYQESVTSGTASQREVPSSENIDADGSATHSRGLHVQESCSIAGVDQNVGPKPVEYNELKYAEEDAEKRPNAVVDQHEKSPGRPKSVPEKTNLTAAEQFELELESIRGVQMLEIGDPKGIRLLKRQCVRGSSVAAFYLGMAHEHGAAGLAVNLSRARSYYELAASRGNAEAKYNLAVFHQQGLGGLAVSEAEAGRLLAEAAAEGVLEARIALGLEDSPT